MLEKDQESGNITALRSEGEEVEEQGGREGKRLKSHKPIETNGQENEYYKKR